MLAIQMVLKELWTIKIHLLNAWEDSFQNDQLKFDLKVQIIGVKQIGSFEFFYFLLC